MKWPLATALIGAAFITQAALARDGFADVGRYQLIPRVMVPSQNGRVHEQPVLLDTETGQTWRLEKGAQKGKTSGARWVPLDIKPPERADLGGASRASGKKKETRRVFDSSRAYINQNRRLDEFYDDDP